MLPDSVSQPMQLPLLRDVFASARTPVSLLSNCDFQPAKHESVWANVAAPPLNLSENHVSGQITIIPKPELRGMTPYNHHHLGWILGGEWSQCDLPIDMSPRCDVNWCTKNVIILVVTVTGRGDNPNYTLGRFYPKKFSGLMSTKVCVKGKSVWWQNLNSRGIQCTLPHTRPKNVHVEQVNVKNFAKFEGSLHKYSQRVFSSEYHGLKSFGIPWGWYPQKKLFAFLIISQNDSLFGKSFSTGTPKK